MFKKILLPAVTIFIILTAFMMKKNVTLQESPSSLQVSKLKPNRFALIELFTSEGCSSCPPADALVEKIKKEFQDKPLYILAYHVDYWDKLGWKDVFSSPIFSAMQIQYAKWLNIRNVYTPQIVVNGSKEFIGSDEPILRKALSEALSKNSKNELALTAKKIKSGRIAIDYKIQGETADLSLMVAFVQPNGTNSILKGENSGRTLSHIQIVRQINTIELNGKQSGRDSISYDEKLFKNPEIIAFIQSTETGEVFAASKTILQPQQ